MVRRMEADVAGQRPLTAEELADSWGDDQGGEWTTARRRLSRWRRMFRRMRATPE